MSAIAPATSVDPAVADADAYLQCPLCDYDLRGLTENRCPECGHSFDPDELRRTRAERQANWSFEHASRRRIVRAFVSTSVLSLLPFLFWKRLTAAHAIRSRRLAWWGIAWVVLTFGVFGVAYALIAVRVHGQALPFNRNAPIVRGPVPRATWQQAIDIALANGRLRELAKSALAHTAYLRIRHAVGQAILITIVNLLAMLVFALVIIGVD